jgi:hypothetical protein
MTTLASPPVRWFEHGGAECLSKSPLFLLCGGQIEMLSEGGPGGRAHPRGQALVEIELLTRLLFDTRHAGRVRWTCVYPAYPPHLPLMCRLFPSVRFYAYGAPDGAGGEYDPERPAERPPPYRPADCDANVTAVCQAFDSETARLLGGRARSWEDRLCLLLTDRLTATRQLLYHSLVKPSYSLLSLTGTVPEEYLSGELYFPIYSCAGSDLVHLVAPGNACARLYYPLWLRDELAYFQLLVRCGTDYDARAEAHIIGAYLRAAWGRDDQAQCEWVRAALPAA